MMEGAFDFSVLVSVIWLGFFGGPSNGAPTSNNVPDHFQAMRYGPPFTLDQCEAFVTPLKEKVEPCIFVNHQDAVSCVRSKLSEHEYEEFEFLFKFGCVLPGASGSVETHFALKDVNPCEQFIPRLQGTYGEWEKFENKMKDFVTKKLSTIIPKVPESWLKNYPWDGGRGRIGKWEDEHPGKLEDGETGRKQVEKYHPECMIQHDKSQTKGPSLDTDPKKISKLTKGEKRVLAKLQMTLNRMQQRKQGNTTQLIKSVENLPMDQASQRKHRKGRGPAHPRERVRVPMFDERPCKILNEFNQEVTYQEAPKDENGYVRAVCFDPKMIKQNATLPEVHDSDQPKWGFIPIPVNGEDHNETHMVDRTSRPGLKTPNGKNPKGHPKQVIEGSSPTSLYARASAIGPRTVLHSSPVGIDFQKHKRQARPPARTKNPETIYYYKNKLLAHDCYKPQRQAVCYIMWKPEIA